MNALSGPDAWQRLLVTVLATLLVTLMLPGLADAKWKPIETEQVPISRLLKNLDRIVGEKPDDADNHYQLGRAHAMAWYLGVDSNITIKKGRTTVWFGRSNKVIQYDKFSPADPDDLDGDREHLDLAVEHLQRALELDPKQPWARLTLGWVHHQRGDVATAIDIYRTLYQETSEDVSDHSGPSAYPISREVGEYLLDLLDADKDADEFKAIQEHVAEMENMPRAKTPIVLPTAANMTLAHAIDLDAAVDFDLDGEGTTRWQWLSPQGAWLVHDPSGSGTIASGLQLFGNVTFWIFWDHGYQALAALDDNGDGWLRDDELVGLAAWQDADGDGVSDPGEVTSLGDLGIVGLAVDSQVVDGVRMNAAGVEMRDGTIRPSWDWMPRSVPSPHT